MMSLDPLPKNYIYRIYLTHFHCVTSTGAEMQEAFITFENLFISEEVLSAYLHPQHDFYHALHRVTPIQKKRKCNLVI